MKEAKQKNILSLNSEERYSYFIRKVADFELVWGLHDNGWAMLKDDEENEVIPFWPEKEFAEICATDQWANYKPTSIDLNKFQTVWLLGMINEKKRVGVFYKPSGQGIIVSAQKLNEDISNECAQYR